VQEGVVSALATAPLFSAPAAVEDAPRGGPLTLEERLERDLRAVLAAAGADCPLCGGAMARASEVEARCGDCGTTLS
jgi:tRNA(Ile2) C34 agmatinyltransferase TiaS